MIRVMLEKLKKFYNFLWPSKKEVKDNYTEELQTLARPYFFIIALLCSWVWLPYIEIDQQLHPYYKDVEPLRWGFSIVSCSLLILFYIMKGRAAELLLRVLFLYLMLSVAWLTASSHAQANYLAGYFLCLLCTSTLPMKFSFILGSINASFLLYALTCWHFEVDFSSVEQQYGLQDTISVWLCCHIFGFSLHRMRKSLHAQAVQLKQQGTKLQEALEQRIKQVNQAYKDLRESLEQRRFQENQLKQTENMLDKIVGQGEKKMENERLDMADQLHDTVKQSLALSKLKIDQLHLKVNEDEVRTELLQVTQQLRTAIEDTQEMIQGISMRLLDDFGLKIAVQEWVETFQKRSGVMVNLQWSDAINLSDELTRHLYRSSQELLNNVLKHSGANSCRMTFQILGDGCCLMVEDLGKGFNSEDKLSQESYGLFRLRQRCQALNGKFEIKSDLNQGTKVTMTF